MTNEEAIEILQTADFSEDYTVEEVQQALDMAICALKNEQSENVGMCQQNVGEMSEKQTDEDSIRRKAVKDLIRGLTKWYVRSQDRKFDNVGLLYDDVMFGIDRLPSEENTAEWVDMGFKEEEYGEFGKCSNCGVETLLGSNYCPNCGRRMKGVE